MSFHETQLKRQIELREKMLEKISLTEQIIEELKEIISYENSKGVQSGVYFLKQKNKIVYVGKSTNSMAKRVYTHLDDDNKVFDNIDLIPMRSEADIHIAELMFIQKYQPEYNKDTKSNDELTLKITAGEDTYLDIENYKVETFKDRYEPYKVFEEDNDLAHRKGFFETREFTDELPFGAKSL